MSGYTDLFVIPVPKKKAKDYRKLAEMSASIWTEHGALSYVEVEADDAKPGKWTSFPQSVDLKDDEFVVVALITYRSRTHRDEVNAKAMADPRMKDMNPKSMPFDGKRMFWGGFKPFLGRAANVSEATVGDAEVTAPGAAIQPYLFFRGRCEEAISYYKKSLGAEVLMMMRFKDNPDKPGPDKVAKALDDKIMHACLRINGADIMMSDGMKGGPLDFQCMSLSLTVPTEAKADRIFKALAKDGTIQMPMGPTFFAKRFGAVADKFGVSWMVIVPPNT